MNKRTLSIAPLRTDDIGPFAFSQNSRFLALAQNGEAGLVDIETGVLVGTAKVPGNKSWAVLPSSSGEGFFAGEKAVCNFPMPKGKRQPLDKKHKWAAVGMALDQAEERLLTLDGHNAAPYKVRLYDVGTSALLSMFADAKKEWTYRLNAGVIVSDQEVAALDADYTFRRWNIESGKLVHKQSLVIASDVGQDWKDTSPPSALSKDGGVAVDFIRGEIVAWSTADGLPLWRRPAHRLVAVDASCTRLITAFDDGGQWKRTLHNRSSGEDVDVTDALPAAKMAMSPDGKLLAAIVGESELQIIDLPTEA